MGRTTGAAESSGSCLEPSSIHEEVEDLLVDLQPTRAQRAHTRQICIYIYIYIYMCMCVCIYIYVYVYDY